jgi:hypothetical protein
MTFATPWGLLALVAIPIIVVIHLFRRRFPLRPVAGLFLWQMAQRSPEGGGRIAPLPITASLLLECLAALALALILAGARLWSATTTEHLVVLLDDSASMSATNAAGVSARDRAIQRIRSEAERLGGDGRLTLIRSGERPAVLAGPAALQAEAMRALEGWVPRATHHSLALGLRLARELASESGRLMIVSDEVPDGKGDTAPARALWVGVGEAAPNVAIVAAERLPAGDSGQGAIALTLGNYAEAAAVRRLRVTAGDREIAGREVEVPAGVSSLTLAIPAGLPAVRVSLSADAMRRDDDVVLVEPRPRIVAAENRLPDGRGRDALTRALAALAQVTPADVGHLQFVDAASLEAARPPGVWRAAFGRAPSRLLAAGGPQDLIGPFVLEKRHPLLLGVTLAGIVWSEAAPLAAVPRTLVSAGDRPLVAMPGATASQDGADVLVNVDLDRTNLVRSPDWPILISNLVEMRRQALPGPARWNYRIGEWARVRLDHDPAAPLVLRNGESQRTLPSGRLLEFVVPGPGGLIQIVEGEGTLFELAANFMDDTESDLRSRRSGEAGAFATPRAGFDVETGLASDPLFWFLLATAGAALVGNWTAVRHHT